VTVLSTGSVGTTTTSTTAAPTTTTAPPTTVTTAPPASGCRESFETSDGGWASWWSGTVTRVANQAATGSYSLQLDGSPETARTLVDPARCGAVNGVSFAARTSAGSASLYLKRVVTSTGVSTVFGPYPISNSWQTISVPAAIDAPSLIGIEIYPASGASVWIDDVTLLGSVTATTTTTTAPPTTAPPTTVPAGSCPTESFEGGAGGWTAWWNGTAAVTNAGGATGASSLRLNGSPGTAQKVLDPLTCAGTFGVEFSARVASGTGSVYVKLIDQVTGGSRLFGPFAATSSWAKVTVRASLTGRTMVALEAYSGATIVDIDDVTLLRS
jgi:hypothetical protein